MSKLSIKQLSDKLKDNPFPVATTDPEIKNNKKFGLKVAKHIYFKGIHEDVSTGRRKIAQENRDYGSNRNDVNKYKKLLDATIDKDGDKSYINIDWSNQHPGKKFVDILVGDMVNQEYKIQFNAIDSHSKENLRKDRDNFYGKVAKAEAMARLEAASGLVLEEKGDFYPASREEVEIYMDLEYKQAIEIGMESIVDFELLQNKWGKKISKRVIRDFVENNIGGVRLYFDKNNNIKIKYVDAPASYGSSASDEPDGSDVDYEYEITTYSLAELRRRDINNDVSEEQWFKIAKDNQNKFGNPRWRYGDAYSESNTYNGFKYSYSDYRIEVLDFVYYTTDRMTWAESEDKYGGKHFSKKNSGYRKPKRSKKNIEVTEKELRMSYEGLYVINSDILLGYGRTKNILRPQMENGDISPELIKRYVVFQPNVSGGTSKSFVGVIKPNLDTIQTLVLRKRHVIAEMTPVGAAYDVSGLQDVMAALGETDPLNIVKLYKQKGILFHSRTDVNGDPVNGVPIQEMTNPFAEQLIAIDNAIINEIEHIRSNTGINDARDGSSPDKDALVGIEKMRLLASNNTTRELYSGYFDGVYGEIGRVIARMVQYKVEFGGGIKGYENVIGELGVKSVEFAKDIVMAQMGIKIEALPTDAEVQELLDMLKVALQAGEIRPEDYLEIKRVMNIKKAERLLIYRRKKYSEEKMEQMAQEQQITAEREQAAIAASAEADKVKNASKSEEEIRVLREEYRLKKEFATHTANEDMKKIDRENYWKERLLEKQLMDDDPAGDMVDKPKIMQNPGGAIERQADINP
jgi:hypothetical protein